MRTRSYILWEKKISNCKDLKWHNLFNFRTNTRKVGSYLCFCLKHEAGSLWKQIRRNNWKSQIRSPCNGKLRVNKFDSKRSVLEYWTCHYAEIFYKFNNRSFRSSRYFLGKWIVWVHLLLISRLFRYWWQNRNHQQKIEFIKRTFWFVE